MWAEDPSKQRANQNEHIDYHTKSRLLNLVSFFLEYYNHRLAQHRKLEKEQAGSSDFEPSGRQLMGVLDLPFLAFLTDQIREQGKMAMMNPERLIIAMRSALEVVKITGEVFFFLSSFFLSNSGEV